MKRKFTFYLSLVGLSLLLTTACSKEKKFAKSLVGIWSLDKIEFTSASDPLLSFEATNAGTIEFKKDGTGKNDYTYTVGGTQYNDNEAFKWDNVDDETVIIEGNANNGDKINEFTVNDYTADTQVWTNVESDGDSTILTLTKLD